MGRPSLDLLTHSLRVNTVLSTGRTVGTKRLGVEVEKDAGGAFWQAAIPGQRVGLSVSPPSWRDPHPLGEEREDVAVASGWPSLALSNVDDPSTGSRKPCSDFYFL